MSAPLMTRAQRIAVAVWRRRAVRTDFWRGWAKCTTRPFLEWIEVPAAEAEAEFARGETRPVHPPLDVWRLVCRLAPKARFSDLSDALLDQGYCITVTSGHSDSCPESQP